MQKKIIFSNDVFEEIQKRLGEIDIPRYKFRNFFSSEYKIFFDCEKDPLECLEPILGYENYQRFVVYFIVRDEQGNLSVMDVSFSNPGKETIEHFIRRYPTQLKPANAMALQLSGREYLEYLGTSYED